MSDEPQISELRDGRWVPACPEPLWVGWRLRIAQCECGEKFKDRTGEVYRRHWHAEHGAALEARLRCHLLASLIAELLDNFTPCVSAWEQNDPGSIDADGLAERMRAALGRNQGSPTAEARPVPKGPWSP